MIETGNLLKKIGFYKTLEILSINGNSIRLREFYEKLLEGKSYHNAFLRIKSEMIEKELINIYYRKIKSKGYPKTKMIKLTPKGITVKQTLKALTGLIG